MNADPKKTLIYDGDCQLCRQFVHFLQRWDKNQKFIYRPLQDQDIYKDFPTITPEETAKAIHLIDFNGDIFRGAEIIEPLLVEFPKVKNITWMLGLPGARSAAHVVYEFISESRKKISKLCPGCH